MIYKVLVMIIRMELPKLSEERISETRRSEKTVMSVHVD